MSMIRLPVMGEGIHEGKIVSIKKAIGETVRKDEIIYELETDKALTEVESPFAGVVKKWFVEEGGVINVGDRIVEIEASQVSRKLSPRVRRALKCGSESLGNRSLDYTEKSLSPLSKKIYAHVGQKLAPMLAASVNRQLSEEAFKRIVARVREQTKSNAFVSDLQCFAYHLSTVLKSNKLFNSVLIKDKIRCYNSFNLGIAVSTPEGELNNAVLKNVGDMTFDEFSLCYQSSVIAAQAGQDQIERRVPFILSMLGGSGLSFAIPLLVPPASYVLYISDVTSYGGERIYNLTLTFNHLIASGIQAANFLKQLTSNPPNQTENTYLSGHESVETVILSILLAEFNIDADPAYSLAEQGLDSLAAVRLVLTLNSRFNLCMPETIIWQSPTVMKLSDVVRSYDAVSATNMCCPNIN